jgi:hypothetical protein
MSRDPKAGCPIPVPPRRSFLGARNGGAVPYIVLPNEGLAGIPEAELPPDVRARDFAYLWDPAEPDRARGST